MTTRTLLCAVSIVCLGITLPGQAQKPTFEAASVKKVDQVVDGFFNSGPPIRGGSVQLLNRTLASVIQFAYGVRDVQVVGGPDWIRTDLFEIYAKTPGEPERADVLRMLQALLEERFGLVLHREDRDMRFLAMTVARSDRQPGPYLHRTSDGPICDYKEFDAIEKARPKPVVFVAMGFLCASLTNVVEIASRNVELPVFDRTGLTGRWTGTLYFAPDPTLSTIRLAAAPDPNLASFPVALQEQFGLKLEPTRGPVEVLVVDSVHQPTEN